MLEIATKAPSSDLVEAQTLMRVYQQQQQQPPPRLDKSARSSPKTPPPRSSPKTPPPLSRSLSLSPAPTHLRVVSPAKCNTDSPCNVVDAAVGLHPWLKARVEQARACRRVRESLLSEMRAAPLPSATKSEPPPDENAWCAAQCKRAVGEWPSALREAMLLLAVASPLHQTAAPTPPKWASSEVSCDNSESIKRLLDRFDQAHALALLFPRSVGAKKHHVQAKVLGALAARFVAESGPIGLLEQRLTDTYLSHLFKFVRHGVVQLLDCAWCDATVPEPDKMSDLFEQSIDPDAAARDAALDLCCAPFDRYAASPSVLRSSVGEELRARAVRTPTPSPPQLPLSLEVMWQLGAVSSDSLTARALEIKDAQLAHDMDIAMREWREALIKHVRRECGAHAGIFDLY